MKILIDIPEVTANEIKDNAMFAKEIASGIKWDITSAIVNGTPLDDIGTEMEIHCDCTDEEIAKSFIEDVENVVDIIDKYRGEA